eukprot:jgi/Psemu1/282990/fgenesh1_pg.18_\
MNSSSVVAASTSVARRLRRLSSSGGITVSSRVSPSVGSAVTGNHKTLVPNATNVVSVDPPSLVQRRFMGSGGGNRGARGHGWWVNYRAGKGGRHLQGTYSHLDLESMAQWNDAIFQMGRQLAYLDVKVEALADDKDGEAKAGDEPSKNNSDNPQQPNTVHRLTLELATEVLPLATDNVMKLLDDNNDGSDSESESLGSDTPGPNHQAPHGPLPPLPPHADHCHPSHRMRTSPTAMDISSEKLVLHHLPGVVTMLQPRIGEIDSRFLVLSHNAPHLDGVSLAVGRLVDGLEAIQTWESSLITSHGVPTNVVLRVVGCGLLPEDPSDSVAAA